MVHSWCGDPDPVGLGHAGIRIADHGCDLDPVPTRPDPNELNSNKQKQSNIALVKIMKTRKTFRKTPIAIAIAMALSPIAMNVYADDVEVIPDSGDNFRVRNAGDTAAALRVHEGGEVFAPNLDTGSTGPHLCRDAGSGDSRG